MVWNGCGSSSDDSAEAGAVSVKKRGSPDSLIIELEGQAGKSVFEITRGAHDIGFIDSDAGVFVYSIDSLEINSDYGWMYSVNNSMGRVASDRYITGDGDTIRWHYRKF
jgi:hypothetical protein